MSVEIRQIAPGKRELLPFVHFPIDALYSDNPYYVPALVTDEVDTLRPDRNPAFEFCDSVYFMAYVDGKPVGRIAGIINKAVNERKGMKELRFGFVDFIDSDEVVDALFKAVIDWGKKQGLTRLTGPLGFTDMDPEGCLVEGFDQLSNQATIYNHPYYSKQFERIGMVKDVDWVEMKITVPPEVPEKMARVAAIVRERYNLRNIKFKSRKKLVNQYGEAIFNLINEAYDSLFGYSPLSQAQIDHYIKMYLPFLPLDDLSLVVKQDGTLIGVGIAIPSLSRALIKCRGRLFPTGWYHLLKAFKTKNDIVDLMLIAVKPEYQNKGVNAMFFDDLIPYFNKFGYKWAESNPELEENQKVLQQWKFFELEQHKRRRAYTMEI
ncbi:MAG: N-acetyltransferase [Muribaculaceae bacterium]|nr:N-acetyltransferase [Muribaculaceae bacterium]